MSELKGLRVVVAGAGAVGSVLALVLARRGAEVTLADPAPLGANASGVAAGMLAPLSEVLSDAASAGHFDLYKAARDAWPALADSLDGAPAIDRSGALLQLPDPDAALAHARAIGAALSRTDVAPSGQASTAFLFTPEDWRLEPRPMLQALHRALEAHGGEHLQDEVIGLRERAVGLKDGGTVAADVLVLSTGFAGGSLSPIKGQILRFPGFGPATGPVVRGQGAYAVPSRDGLLVGATMELGRSDLTLDADAAARLKTAAERLAPGLENAPYEAFAGVRAATPDGLPLVGPEDAPGVFVARGVRRNGWLLAPLMAQVLIERLQGPARSEAAHAFDPARFPTAR